MGGNLRRQIRVRGSQLRTTNDDPTLRADRNLTAYYKVGEKGELNRLDKKHLGKAAKKAAKREKTKSMQAAREAL